MSDKNLIQTKKLWITLADDVVVAEKFHKFLVFFQFEFSPSYCFF